MLPTVMCGFLETRGPWKFVAGVVNFLGLFGFAKSWLCLAFCETKFSKAISLRLLEFLVERSSCPFDRCLIFRIPFPHTRLFETVIKQGICAFHTFSWSWKLILNESEGKLCGFLFSFSFLLIFELATQNFCRLLAVPPQFFGLPDVFWRTCGDFLSFTFVLVVHHIPFRIFSHGHHRKGNFEPSL